MQHPWVNQGLDKPMSSLLETRNAVDKIDPDVIKQLSALGYAKQGVEFDLLRHKTTAPTFILYHLMLDTKEREARQQDKEGSLPTTPNPKNGLSSSPVNNHVQRETEPIVESVSRPTPIKKPAEEPNTNSNLTGKEVTGSPKPKTALDESNTTNSSLDEGTLSEDSEDGASKSENGFFAKFKSKVTPNRSRTGTFQLKSVKAGVVIDKHSTKSVGAIQQEIERVLQKLNLTYKKKKPTKYSMAWKDKEQKENCWKITMEICQIERSEKKGIKMKRKQGSAWNYKELAKQIYSELDI